MKRRDHVIIFVMMACFTGAVLLNTVYQEQARRRGIVNAEVICEMFAKVTTEPCLLQRPPASTFDPKVP